MDLKLSVPDAVASPLKLAFGDDLGRAAREALACEGYRSRRFGAGIVSELLCLSDRWAAEQWLASRGLTYQYGTQDLAEDRQTLVELLKPYT